MTVTASEKAKDLFYAEFAKARMEYAADVPTTEIRSAGKPTKANPYGEGELWWWSSGPEMVQRWIDWRASSGWKIWTTPDDRPAIELELHPIFDGVPVKMFVDRVFVVPETRRLVVVDLKSGRRTPSSDLQLAFYAAGIEATFNIPVSYGAYWMARTGELTPVQDIERFHTPVLAKWVKQFDEARRAGIFLPNLSELCRACGVNRFCYAYGGRKSEVDPDAEAALGIPF